MENIKIKVIAYIGMISMLLSLVVGLLGYSNYTEEINNVKNQILMQNAKYDINLSMKYIKNSYGELTQGYGTLLDKNGNSIAGDYAVVDSIFYDLGDKSTIFVKENNNFKRISTNVMTEDNKRAIDTYLGTDHKAYETVMNGEMYIGEAVILGENYYTAYDAIKDKNNNVIGLLFIGTPTKTFDDIIDVHGEEMSRINMLIVSLRAVSLASLIALVSASARRKETRV